MNDYKPLEERAIKAGVSRELAHLMYNVARDAEEHGWKEELKDWTGAWDDMISLALKSPERMEAVCNYHFATDGGSYREGLENLDERCLAIARFVFAKGWAAPLPKDLPAPPPPRLSRDAPASESEILEEMKKAVLVKYPGMDVELSCLAIHATEKGLRKFYAAVTVNNPAMSPHTGQNISDGIVTGIESVGFDLVLFEYLARWDRTEWETKMGYRKDA